MSLPCETCPLLHGFPISDGLDVCGSPVPQCRDFRDKIADRTAAWVRLSTIAELGSNRMVDMKLLRPGDYVEVLTTSEWSKGYAASGDQKLVSFLGFTVLRVDHEGHVQAQVEEDRMFAGDTTEHEMTWPMEEGERIIMLGSCSDGTEGHANDAPDCDSDGGFLHAGRLLTFRRRDQTTFCTPLIQEVSITDPSGISMDIFDTIPEVFRGPITDHDT